jgi:hypothetical protein
VFGQDDTLVTQTIELIKAIEKDSFKINYNQFDRYERNKKQKQIADSLIAAGSIDSTEYMLKKYQHKFMLKNENPLNGARGSREISLILYKLEEHNFSETELTAQSLEILQSYSELKALSVLLEFVIRDRNNGNAHYSIVREKLIHSISNQMKILADNTLPWYNYETKDKRGIKGFQLEHGNDLLTFGLIQTNNDMDYTGALKLSLITDLFKMRLGRVNKSYQVFTYGGEVYTPYFKDTNIFVKNDTFNVLDRPHACFQYVGFENHGINDKHSARWVTDVKVGIMGGEFGNNFQFFLHRDISLSPAPVGWDAQIAAPGRLAVQARFKYEHLLVAKSAAYYGSGLRFVPSISAEVAGGHFMTYGQLGLNISTHNFRYKNSHNTLSKTRYTGRVEKMERIRFFGDFDLSLRGVVHNSTLTGYSLFGKTEENPKSFAEPSKYKIDEKNVAGAVLFNNLTLGLQFPSMNVFYRYSIKSPEYKSEGMLHTFEGETLDPSKRWHHWATVGVTFIL